MEKQWVEIMDASCAMALDFDLFVEKWNVGNVDGCDASGGNGSGKIGWSLVHGDYHPGNMLCLSPSSFSSPCPSSNDDESKEDLAPRLILLDWEVVGIGSGPQDIGQFLISHLETHEACDMLEEVVSVYRESLIDTLDAVNPLQSAHVPSLQDLRREVVFGGLERWIWLFGYMSGWESSMPPLYMQYFHDQVYEWAARNGITPKNVGMPRP